MEQKTPSDLLSEITAFIAETGMGVKYFGKKAVGNSEIVSRLEKGGRVWPETAAQLRKFMRAESKARAASNQNQGAA